MNNLTVKIDKEEFLKKPESEQHWLLYGALNGHEERIAKLEKQKWIKGSLAFAGGIIGGVAAKIGLG